MTWQYFTCFVCLYYNYLHNFYYNQQQSACYYSC